jgi:catechol 2,3-dioxygenase-like lactoylglutathione lyase family enzyme
MSPNVAVRTTRLDEAVDFYTNVLGFQNRSDDPELADLDASPLTLYVDADPEFRGPILELFVENLKEARDELVAHGCTVLRWRGKGQDCYVQDPFGVIYNLWED